MTPQAKKVSKTPPRRRGSSGAKVGTVLKLTPEELKEIGEFDEKVVNSRLRVAVLAENIDKLRRQRDQLLDELEKMHASRLERVQKIVALKGGDLDKETWQFSAQDGTLTRAK